MKWQPIETAPTKKPILITDGKIVTVTILDMCGDDPKWMFGYGFGGYEWEFDFDFKSATHWKKLDEPPTASLGSQG